MTATARCATAPQHRSHRRRGHPLCRLLRRAKLYRRRATGPSPSSSSRSGTTGQFVENVLGDLNKHLSTTHGFDGFFGNLNVEDEPELPDYPDSDQFPLLAELQRQRGHHACDKKLNVHLDAFNVLPYLTGEVAESARRGFSYSPDCVLGIRFHNWKVAFQEQSCAGPLRWAESFMHLRFPKIVNLAR